MYDKIIQELAANHVDLRRIRKEPFPIEDITTHPEFPEELKDEEFEIEVHQGIHITRIRGLAKESIATALERSGLRIHTGCRAGACGLCRIKVLEGSYFIPSDLDHRRAADKEYNYVHSCSTYPTSNLKIKINIS
jgi:ferredoxin